MADDAPFPLYGSTFSDQGEQPPADIPFPIYGSTFGKETIRDPVAAGAGTGLSGVPAQRGTWEDVAHSGAAGIHELGATGAGFMASMSGDTKTEAGWRQAALEQQQAAQESREEITPTVQPGLTHPIMWAAEQGPGLAAMAIPAAAATAVAGPVGGAAVLSGVMGAQTRGDVYNRLTGEGITPTSGQLAVATGVGAVQGVATELTGGLVSKLPVSKLVGRALGVTGDAGAFGAGAAGQEYTTQQAEIAAGQRDRIDPNAVGSAFVGGAEMGAGFGVPHLLGSGRHRDLTQTPGQASVAREDPAARQEQAKPRATAGGESAPSTATDAARQPPTSPLADPTLAAGAKGETVTPGSNEQAEPVVQQSGVAQPAPTAAGTATEGPPAGDTTGVGSPLPRAAEPGPAPAAAPSGEAVAPEPQATIQAQHAALLDPNDPREAMVYNKGEQPIDITGNDRIGQTRLKDGRVVQYDKEGPNDLTPKKIGQYARTDRLNELLQNSTVSKDKAADLAVAGVGEPAVVTTRKPSPDGVTPGTEVKAGATTTAVAPDDVALHEATKAPGDTVQVEHPAATIGDRFKQAREDAVQQSLAAQREREQATVTPESKPEPVAAAPVAPIDPLAGATKLSENKFGVSVHQMPDGTYRKVKDGVVSTISEDTAKILTGEKTYAAETSAAEAIRQQAEKTAPKGRVFRSETAEEQAAAARQAEADRIAAERVATEKPTAKPIKEKEEMKEKNLSAEKRDELLRINRIGDEAVDAHPIGPKDGLAIDPNQPGGQGARTELLNRVRAMVKDATDKGYKLMKPLRERIGETNHTNKNILLHEADLLGRKKVAKTSDIRRYLNSEHELLHNGEEGRANVMKMRSETGKELAAERGKGVKERAAEDIEQAAAPTVREGVKEGAAIEKPDVGDEYEAAKERVADEEVAKEPGVQRELTERQRAAIEAGKRAAARVAEEERAKAAGGRERPTVTPKSEEGAEGEEPAVKGYGDRTAAFKVEKRRTVTKPKGSYMGEVVEFPDRRPKPLTDEERQQVVDMGWTRAELAKMTPAEARRVVDERMVLPKTNREQAKKWNEYLIKARNRRDYLEDLQDRRPITYQEGVDKENIGKNLKEVYDAIDNVVARLYQLHEQDIETLGMHKEMPPAANDLKGKYIGDDTPTATELKLRRAGWDEDEIRDFLDNSTPKEIKEAVDDAQTVAGERWGKAQEEKPEPAFDREFFRQNGLSEDDIDELERLSKEPEGELVGPDFYPAREQVEHLQVPNRAKDPDHVNLETSGGKWFSLKVRRNSNVRDMLHEIADEVRQSGLVTGELAHDVLQRILTLVGDVPVRYIPKKELYKFAASDLGEDARVIKPAGFYSWDTHQILINDQPELHEWSVHTKFHEAIHAATSLAMERFPEFKAQIKEIMSHAYWDEAASELGGTSYAFKDEHEFVAEIFSNPKLREYLASRNIPNDLKKSLVDLAAWRKLTGFKRAIKTMWDLTAMLIGKVLKLPPRGVSYLEATLHLTERYMEQHAKDVAAGEPITFKSGGSKSPIERGRYIQQPEEQVKTSAKEAQEATRKPWEFWKTELAKSVKSGTEEAGYKAFTKASNFDTLRIASEHLFGRRDDNNSFRRVQEGTAKMDQAIRTMLGEHDPLVQRVADMKKANPDGLDRIVTLLSESADYGVHPDHALGQGRNSYINPRSKQFDETAGREHHEAILAHPRLSDEYNRSTPDEQKLFRDLRDAMMVEGRKNAQAHYDSFSSALRYNFEKDAALQEALGKSENARSPAELKKVERYNAVTKVLDGDKLEGDEKEQFYNDPQISALRELKNLQKQEEPYMPSTRKGEWVVNAEHDIPKADNAISQKDNEAVFSTLKDAYDYRKTLVDNSLPSTLETIREPTSSEQGRGSGADTYRVTVQNKHSSAVETKYEGDKMAETLRAQGVKNVTNPMLREKNEHIDYGLHSGTVRAIGHAIDALTHLSKEERQVQHDALEQASLGLMRGNRINQGLMRRNRVKGANADPVLAVHDYFAASARNRAQARFMPDMNRALDEMREHSRATQDADTWKRGLLIRQAEERALNFGKDGFTGQMPNALQNLSTLAFVKYMMAPVHYALDLTHPYLISIPQIAGRHGMAKTQLEFQKTLGDMGGRFPTLLKGGKGMWEAALKSGHMPTDFAAMIRARLEKNKAAPDELRAFDQAMETGALHSILMDFRPHFEKTGNVDRALQRAQSVGQEMSSAVDAINRIATYMTAYKLERSRMIGPQQPGSFAHHAQAIRYAKDVVTQTQGLYTPSNRAAMLRNPMVRAAMQFRSVPMMIYKVMARNIYDMVKPETPEVRWAAVRSFVGTMGTTALLAGAPAGVPEPIRLAIMLTHALGLTGSWEDLEDAARREADNFLGKIGGRVVMDGVLGAAGLSAGNRLGLSDLFIKGEPQSAKDFVFQLMGAQAGYATDEIKGINQILHGDLQHGLPAGIPIRFFSDVAKAYYDNQEGKPGRGATPAMQPLDPYETFVRAMGGTPTREANYYKMTGLIQEAKTNKQAAVQAGIGGNMTAVTQWNAAHPHDRISPTSVLKAKQNRQGGTPAQRRTAEDYSAYQ